MDEGRDRPTRPRDRGRSPSPPRLYRGDDEDRGTGAQMTRIAISSGHGKYIRGARGDPVPPQLDEVDEARKVVERVADFLRGAGVEVATFHDNTSTTQSQNLDTIVNWHNRQTRDL